MEDLITYTYFGRDPFSSVEVALKGNNKLNGFATFQILINQNSIEKYKRSFPKVQSLIANLGGIIKFILTISTFFSEYITSQMLMAELSNNFIYSDKDSIDLKPVPNIQSSGINLKLPHRSVIKNHQVNKIVNNNLKLS
jgi:hypothetical protein